MKRVSVYMTELFEVDFTDEIMALLDKNTSIVRFSDGDIVLHEGNSASHVYLIMKGIVRGYYIDCEGNDITKCFSVEGEFFSTEGFREKGVSSFIIECLEECVCIKMPYDFMHQLINESEQLKALVNSVYLQELGRLEKRAQSLLLKDAKARYQEFLKDYPDLPQRVPLKYIASYIGIRPASLSRIRKEMNDSVT